MPAALIFKYDRYHTENNAAYIIHSVSGVIISLVMRRLGYSLPRVSRLFEVYDYLLIFIFSTYDGAGIRETTRMRSDEFHLTIPALQR